MGGLLSSRESVRLGLALTENVSILVRLAWPAPPRLARSAHPVLAAAGNLDRVPRAVPDLSRRPGSQPLRRPVVGLAEPRLCAAARAEGRIADVRRGPGARARCGALQRRPRGEGARHLCAEWRALHDRAPRLCRRRGTRAG